jgi:DNA-binding transcriptional LysR family regulator
MNLRSADLNLLVALDALLSELHVTRAADRIGLALSNLPGQRVRCFGRSSAFSKAIPASIRLIPAARLSLRLSDLLGLLLWPALLERVGGEAPGIGLDVLHLPPARTIEALEKDEVDIAVSMGLEHSSSIRKEVVLPDRMVCVMRNTHPIAREPLTLERFLEQRHLKVSMSATDLRFVDDVLARSQLKRDVAVNVPHWLLVPHVLKAHEFSVGDAGPARCRDPRGAARYP